MGKLVSREVYNRGRLISREVYNRGRLISREVYKRGRLISGGAYKRHFTVQEMVDEWQGPSFCVRSLEVSVS